jgi:hypothetical protein
MMAFMFAMRFRGAAVLIPEEKTGTAQIPR